MSTREHGTRTFDEESHLGLLGEGEGQAQASARYGVKSFGRICINHGHGQVAEVRCVQG